MTSFIRPEAKDAITRWREALIGVACTACGLWLFLQPGHLLKFPGGAFLIGGLALLWIGVQRGRFRASGAGPGTVDVDEGRVVYYGPLTGGSIDLRELSRLVYDPTLHPAHWRLEQSGQAALLVPVNAAGAQDLFDAFSTLPGLRMDKVLRATRGASTHSIVLWQRDTSMSAHRTLH